MRRFLFASLALFLFPLPAQAAEPVTGWGRLLLGMSVEEAKAARPEFDWDSKQFTECLSSLAMRCWLYAGETEVKLGKLTVHPSFYFDDGGRLEIISLSTSFGRKSGEQGQLEGQPVSPADCLAHFRSLLEPLEQKYGRLTDPHAASLPPEDVITTPLGGRYARPLPSEELYVAEAVSNAEASQRDRKKLKPFDPYIRLSVYAFKHGQCDLGISYNQGFPPSASAIDEIKDQL